jgi:hypothetical protein
MYLERYLHGEHEQVWDELLLQGDAIRQEPLRSDAYAVAKETMRRVRHNVQVLVARLKAMGYKFGIYPDGTTPFYGWSGAHVPPPLNIKHRIASVEALGGVGVLPLSLHVFWEIVGTVNFIGYHPNWPEYADPLVVGPIEVVDAFYDEWRHNVEDGDIEAGLFGIHIAPDFFHKDNVSGGAPYTILVPNAAIDSIVEFERHNTTFVNYLRICFRYGGFPGFEFPKKPLSSELSALPHDLLPI